MAGDSAALSANNLGVEYLGEENVFLQLSQEKANEFLKSFH